jgi:GTP cyclohydrolase IA
MGGDFTKLSPRETARRRALVQVPRDRRQPVPTEYLKEAFERLLVHAEGDGAEREGLAETPARAATAWGELTAGYWGELDLKTFEAEGDQMMTIGGVPFFSLCEHHLLPFYGTAYFAYLPGDRILGLSKFVRLLEHYSRRLQVQERLTTQLADELVAAVEPVGVMVVVRAEHFCMSMRGVQKPGHSTTSSAVRGVMKDDRGARDEAMTLLGLH